MLKFILTVAISSVLFGCGSPKSYLDGVIKEKSYIPYQLPTDDARVGAIIRGNDNLIIPIEDAEVCFPDFQGTKELRKITETNLPSEYRNISVGFSAETNKAIEAGSSSVSFKVGASFIQTVEMSFQGVTEEKLKEGPFLRHYQSGRVEPGCRHLLKREQFIAQGLRVESMSYKFLRKNGAYVDLDLNLAEVVDIHTGVEFSVENRYTLVINTPKYIGYRMARIIEANDNAPYLEYAVSTDKEGRWIFKSLNELNSFSLL